MVGPEIILRFLLLGPACGGLFEFLGGRPRLLACGGVVVVDVVAVEVGTADVVPIAVDSI